MPAQHAVDSATAPAAPTPCVECHQIDQGQYGEYPCSVCDLPRLWGAIPAPIVDAPHSRRQCIPAIHVGTDGDLAVLDVPTITRRGRERAKDILDGHVMALAVKLSPDLDDHARRHLARNLVTAIALDASTIVRADAEERIRVAFESAGVDQLKTGVATLARIAAEALK